MKKHFGLMLICCMVPLLLIFALSALGILGSWGFYALILFCPLMYLILLRYEYQHESEESTTTDASGETKLNHSHQ